MAGVLKQRAATLLIGAIRKKYPDLPIHVHTHDSAGTGVASMVACAQAGADAVDAATDSMSGMTSQPSIGALVASLEGGEFETGLNPQHLRAIDSYWAQVRLVYSPFEAGLTGPDPEVYEHEIPGGQLTNLIFQASQQGLGAQWAQTKKAYEQANDLLGDIVKVTPTSKVVGDLAQFMVSNNLTYDELLREILHVGSAISLLRSASENLQDYVPALRYLPNNEKDARSKDLRSRRDAYLNLLLDKVREMIKNGTDKPCISAAILKDEETKLSGVEVSSICLSLVSGGFETIPGTLTSCLGSLCTPEGQIFQERAYADIKRHYPDIRDAWQNSYQEEKVPYLKAIIQEAGRYYTVSSMSLPRRTVTEVNWNGALIPPKTMILVNAQAGNHDVDHFGQDAAVFNPERWLEPITEKNSMGPFEERPLTSQAHLSFGAGTRACSGQLIATRLLYAALIRILSSYKIVASESEPPNTDYVDYNQFKTALVAIPRDFKVRLIPRDKAVMEECMQSAFARTEKHYKEDIKGL